MVVSHFDVRLLRQFPRNWYNNLIKKVILNSLFLLVGAFNNGFAI